MSGTTTARELKGAEGMPVLPLKIPRKRVTMAIATSPIASRPSQFLSRLGKQIFDLSVAEKIFSLLALLVVVAIRDDRAPRGASHRRGPLLDDCGDRPPPIAGGARRDAHDRPVQAPLV